MTNQSRPNGSRLNPDRVPCGGFVRSRYERHDRTEKDVPERPPAVRLQNR
jgi:hypothetical protein